MNDYDYQIALSEHSKLECETCKVIAGCVYHIVGDECKCDSETYHGQKLTIGYDIEL